VNSLYYLSSSQTMLISKQLKDNVIQ